MTKIQIGGIYKSNLSGNYLLLLSILSNDTYEVIISYNPDANIISKAALDEFQYVGTLDINNLGFHALRTPTWSWLFMGKECTDEFARLCTRVYREHMPLLPISEKIQELENRIKCLESNKPKILIAQPYTYHTDSLDAITIKPSGAVLDKIKIYVSKRHRLDSFDIEIPVSEIPSIIKYLEVFVCAKQ